MECYRDIKFCDYHKECRFGEHCHRALTQKVRDKAAEIGLDICQYSEKPECFKEIEDE